MLAHPFFTRRTDISTGRESFGDELADWIVSFGEEFSLQPVDLLATAAQLTVEGVVAAVQPLLANDRRLTKLYLTGGGARNRFFASGLQTRLPGVTVAPIDHLGIPSGLVEAAAYAVMGEACLRSDSLASAATGRAAKVRQILGRIVQPPL